MARPAKAVATQTGHGTSKKPREEKEKSLMDADKPKPPAYLTADQKKIFKSIVTGLEKSGLLCGLDTFVLEEAAVSIDRMRIANRLANDDPLDRDVMKLIDMNQKIFFRCCNELSLSPQARAKLAGAAVADDGTEKLRKILQGEDI
jgi:P27 family predicted phage terminase small subunit